MGRQEHNGYFHRLKGIRVREMRHKEACVTDQGLMIEMGRGSEVIKK